MFDYLSRANSEDKLLRVLFFDGKQETDISKLVSKESLRSAALRTGVWKWGGPTGPFSVLYLFGPILWELGLGEASMYESSLIHLLDNAMPAWAMPIEEQAKRAHIPSAVREAVYLRDGGKCKTCGSKMARRRLYRRAVPRVFAQRIAWSRFAHNSICLRAVVTLIESSEACPRAGITPLPHRDFWFLCTGFRS